MEQTFHYIEYVLQQPLAREAEQCEDDTNGTPLDEFPEFFTGKCR